MEIILPLVLEENNRIRLDRKKLFSILNKNNNTDQEIRWLNSKFKQYGVVKKDLATLKIRMDEVPVSLALAQAAKETGWGTSRFAIEGMLYLDNGLGLGKVLNLQAQTQAMVITKL